MKYTEYQLQFIRRKFPELIYKPELSLNDAIVEFLKKYEVYVTPPKEKIKRKRWSSYSDFQLGFYKTIF